MSIDAVIKQMKEEIAFLERAKEKFPNLKKDRQWLSSSAVNPIADHVDIWQRTWPYAVPYVLFEGMPIFTEPMLIGLATDEHYPIPWQDDMIKAGMNKLIIAKIGGLIHHNGYQNYYDTEESKRFCNDVWYGF